jgi:hypothetical protein
MACGPRWPTRLGRRARSTQIGDGAAEEAGAPGDADTEDAQTLQRVRQFTALQADLHHIASHLSLHPSVLRCAAPWRLPCAARALEALRTACSCVAAVPALHSEHLPQCHSPPRVQARLHAAHVLPGAACVPRVCSVRL